MELQELQHGKKSFIYKGETYKLHYDANEYGIYGITKHLDEYVTFVNKPIHNLQLRTAWRYAKKTFKLS